MRAGDRLLLVSDGVTEAFDAQNTQFGRERLADLLQSAPVNTDGVFRAVQNALLEHTGGTPLRDDVTIVVVGLNGVIAPVAAPAGDSPAPVAGAPTPFQ